MQQKFWYPLKVWDSTLITLGAEIVNWRKYAHAKGAIKLHYTYDLVHDLLCFLVVTEGVMSDRDAVKEHFPLLPDSIYVFDGGYTDYAWYYQVTRQRTYFITRLKKDAHHKMVGQHRQLTATEIK